MTDDAKVIRDVEAACRLLSDDPTEQAIHLDTMIYNDARIRGAFCREHWRRQLELEGAVR